MPPQRAQTPEDLLLADLGRLSSDPYKFALWGFPWGEVGTELEFRTLEKWQIDLLCKVRDGLLTLNEAIQIAVASGHGVGKSCIVAILILWAISTLEDTRGVVTANTENQLKTKTWVELAKWYRMFIARSLFKLTATRLCSVDPERAETWRIDMVPWSENNTEAFAGLHNKGKRILVVFDEASAIPDKIWETTEGALTDNDTQIIWLVCGNPTKNTGRFTDCFDRFSHRWKTIRVDSREVSISNISQIKKWIADYGEDSDFIRVRVRGVFPAVGSSEFISAEDANAATQRDISVHLHDPLVLGCDPARFGDNESVIYIRKGRDGRTHEPIRFRGIDTMTFAAHIAQAVERFRPDAVFIDGTGVGGGVVDRLRQLRVHVFDVQFAGKPDRLNMDDGAVYGNKRAEMWGAMRQWLKGGCIPDDRDFVAQLCGPHYFFKKTDGALMLEGKEEMARRGVQSPDLADALALTFAYPVMTNALAGRDGFDIVSGPLLQTEYDPFSNKYMAL